MDIEIERKHLCEVMMKKCMHCGMINHTRYNCPEFNKQKKKKSDEIEREGCNKQSRDYRKKMQQWRAIPICDRCGDLANPHKSIECKKKFKCNNCGSEEHKTKDYGECSKAITMMTSIMEYLVNRYGKEYKSKIDEIRSDHKYGIGKYEMNIYGKNDSQIKKIQNKKFEMENNNNKQKLDMAILKHLKEKEKNGKLDESDDDDDNIIMEMEEMMNKENVGCSEQMKVPSKGEVQVSIGINKKKETGNKNDGKGKKEERSIFEENENGKISKAKNAIKELEMLMDRRIEMKKQKTGKNKRKNKEDNGNENDSDCEVVTDERQNREKGNVVKNDENRNDNIPKNHNGFQLGYQLNRQCLMMNGKKLNIPNIRSVNPFEKLMKRQRIKNEDGAILRDGSKNYGINSLNEHVEDSDSGSSDDDDDDDEMGQQHDENGQL